MSENKTKEIQTCSVTQQIQIRLEVNITDGIAKLPYRNRATDAGYDLYSVEDIDLPPGRATIVRTGIKIACPPGFYYTVEGRSSLWSKGIFPNRGIIDSTFTGELIVSLVNVSDKIFKISKGDRIAQILIHRQYDANFVVVDEFSEIYNQRGSEGFGSTGR